MRWSTDKKEEVCERALAAELAKRGIPCERQLRVEVSFEGQMVALVFLDLLVEGTVVVEIKAFGHQLTGGGVVTQAAQKRNSPSPEP